MNQQRLPRLFATALLALASVPAFASEATTLPATEFTRLPPSYMVNAVRHELAMLPYYGVFDNILYQVDGSVVTLMGQVNQPTLKADAGRAISRLRGVERVINNIEVLPLSPMDDDIRRAVYRTLFSRSSPLVRYGFSPTPSIHILVKNGHVTLVGLVGSEFDRNVANIRVNGVSGVFSVTNRLQVVKS